MNNIINYHLKKGNGRTTNPLFWRRIHPLIMDPTIFLEPSTHIRICANALRFLGTVQGILPSMIKY